MRVKNKIIIVTGGGSGIGEASCLLLAQQGAFIAVTDIDVTKGENVARKIRDSIGHANFWRMDTANEENVKNVFSEIHSEYKKIDVLVNNAGIPGVNKPTHLVTEKEWDQVMSVNAKGVFFCTKHVIPYLQHNHEGGSIINISSIDGIVGEPDYPPYHASKGAVRLMTKTDALLYAKDKIRVNSIHPGYIWTPLMENQAKEYPGGEVAFRKYADALHPIGHIGEPLDVAYGVLYLASDEAKFITGSELVIDGGFTAR